MTPDQLQQAIATLPPTAQAMVWEFVLFLQQRYGKSSTSHPIDFEDQPFVGMWSDNSAMQDSVQWVEQTRKAQWQRPHA